jgi:hypothetical protein
MVALPSMAHMKAIFAEIKKKYTDIPNQVLREVGQNFALTERAKNAKAPKDVGTIDGAGFSIGVAASQDRPANIRTAMKTDRVVAGGGGRADNPAIPTRDQVFEIFKIRDGKALGTELVQGKKETKELVEQKQKTVAEINETQELIVALGRQIDARRLRDRVQMFEEDASLLRQEHAAKAKYRELYLSLQKTQSRIDLLKEKSSQSRTALLSAFEQWYTKWLNDELYTEKVVPPKSEIDQAQGGKDQGKGKPKVPPPKPVKGKPPPRGRK